MSQSMHLDAVVRMSNKSEADRFVAEPFHRRGPRRLTEKVRKEALEMMQRSDFSTAEPVHFMALHDLLHEQVYGVEDPDLRSPARRGVSSQCSGMLEALGPQVMTDFIRWAWTEEQRRETWRRENHRDGGRLGARSLFSRVKLTEYRISLQRQKAR